MLFQLKIFRNHQRQEVASDVLWAVALLLPIVVSSPGEGPIFGRNHQWAEGLPHRWAGFKMATPQNLNNGHEWILDATVFEQTD